MKRTVLIDGDSAIWIFSYFNKDSGTVEDIKVGLDNWVNSILRNTNADQYVGFLQGPEKSHRHKLFEDYKANRPERPEHVIKWGQVIKDHLISFWGFIFVNGMEVDDAIASLHCSLTGKAVSIICSTDKDYKQLFGEFYNPQKEISFTVSPQEAKINYLTQLLTGDSTDNIKGVPGIGPKTAEKILSTNQTIDGVIEQFIIKYGDPIIGLTYFAETVLKITLVRDLEIPAIFKKVPEELKINVENLFK